MFSWLSALWVKYVDVQPKLVLGLALLLLPSPIIVLIFTPWYICLLLFVLMFIGGWITLWELVG